MDSFSSVPPHIQPPMAQVPSPIRELTRFVPSMLMYSSTLSLSPSLFGNRRVPNQATVGWRMCRRTGGSFYKARTCLLQRLFLFLREAQQLGKNSSVENCGLLEELAEESGANRSP